MKFNLKPDKDLQVQTIRAGKVPTLVVRPAKSPTKRAAKSPAEWSGKCPASDVAVLWIHGGGYITGACWRAITGSRSTTRSRSIR